MQQTTPRRDTRRAGCEHATDAWQAVNLQGPGGSVPQTHFSRTRILDLSAPRENARLISDASIARKISVPARRVESLCVVEAILSVRFVWI